MTELLRFFRYVSSITALITPMLTPRDKIHLLLTRFKRISQDLLF